MHPEFQQIYWYPGVYLQPQHLQSIDLHHSYMLSRYRQLAQPWNFGFIKCEIDSELLVDFHIKIEQLQLLMPSGDYLEYPGNCTLPVRNFRDSWIQKEKPLILWLALRNFDPETANVGRNPNNRWINPTGEIMMKDVYFEGPECSVSRIIYNVQILTEEEIKSAVGCDLLPLIQLHYDNDRVTSDSNFCAPLLDIHSSVALKKLLNGLLAEISYRVYQFEETFGDNNSNIVQYMAKYSLNRIALLLKHYLNSPMIHPWVLYGSLLQFAGEINSLRNDKVDRLSFEEMEYNHYNILTCFSCLKNHIIISLNSITLHSYTRVSLRADNQGGYYADLPSIPKTNTVILSLHSEDMSGNVIPEGSDFKLATKSTIATLIRHALPGISVNLLTEELQNISNRNSTVYFKLEHWGKLWDQVEQQKNIYFYWSDAPTDLQVQIMFMEEM